jgi:hypothetical protein
MMRGLRLVCHVNRAVDEESYQVSRPLFESSNVIDGTCPGSISRRILSRDDTAEVAGNAIDTFKYGVAQGFLHDPCVNLR